MVFDILKQLRKINQSGSFIHSISVTSFWNILIIIVQFTLSPIVTRLYTPSEYGVFALISTIVVPLTMIGSFRYAEAIVICETRRDRNNTVLLSAYSVMTISVITFIIVLLGKEAIVVFVGDSGLGNFIYFIPLIVFFSGLVEILLCLNVSYSKFSYNGLTGFAMNVSSRVFTIGYTFFMQPKAVGLILGELVGKLTALTLLLSSAAKLQQKSIHLFKTTSFSGILYAMRLFKRFPLYVLPTNIVNTLSVYLPIYFLKAQFSLSVIGSYALASSLLEIINRLLPYSIATILFPRAVEWKRKSWAELTSGVYKLYWIMLTFALLIFTGSSLLAEIIFPFVFGESWNTAGVFISLLSIQYAFYFISLPISEVYKVIDRQNFLFIATLASIGLKVISILLLRHYLIGERESIFWFSVISSIGSIVPILGVFYFLNFKLKQVFASLAATFVFLATIIVLLNFK